MEIPTDPIEVARLIAKIQLESKVSHSNVVFILFNKGRYFETSIHSHSLLVSLSKAIKVKIQFNNMLAGSPTKLVALVKALNKRGYYASVKLDWF